MTTDSLTDRISRTIDGVDAFVHASPGELFIDVPAETRQYIQVLEGDTVQEGDIRTRSETELDSPALRKWRIERIGRRTVVGTDRDTGEQQEWDRSTLETKLAIGAFSAELKRFDRANVTGAGTTEAGGDGSDESTLTVTVYGNDGETFRQPYRVSESDARTVEPTDAEPGIEAFEPAVRERFDRAVEQAVREAGYTVEPTSTTS